MAFPSAHVPQRATALLASPGKVSIYEATGGKVTAVFAAHNLTLLPPIPAGSIIHDNAAGAGTVTRAILAGSNGASPNVKIHATDIDQVFLDVLAADALAHSWPVDVSNQRAEALSFPDAFFTHSITNIGIFFTTSGGLDGTKEVYRTLKPGGVAVLNCWETLTWLLPFKLVHEALRPGKPYPAPPILWNDGVQIQKVVREAGFAVEKTRVERSEAWAKTRDLRGWAEKSWAFLGGLGGWAESDGERWDEAVDLLVEFIRKQPGTKEVDGEVWMRATQWVVVATK